MTVEIEGEERYNKLVEEILRRMKENDFYAKYKWKVRKVGFLRVVIEL